MRRWYPLGRAAVLLVTLLAGAPPVRAAGAEDYHGLLRQLLTDHPRVIAAINDLESAAAAADRSGAAWYPELRASYSSGREITRNPPGPPDTRLAARQGHVSLTQPVLDFGRIGGEIDRTAKMHRQAEVRLAAVRQALLLEALTAHITVHRAQNQFEFAAQSVRNIETQTGLEQERVDLGAGVNSDVLQAKSQLSGARARQVRAKGALTAALNRYRAVFEQSPGPLRKVPVPAALLPHSLDEAMEIGRKRNLDFEIARLGIDIADAEVKRVRGTELFPQVEAVADFGLKHNIQGVVGDKREDSFRLQASMPLNLGMAAVSAVDTANASARAVRNRVRDTERLLDERIRNAWEALETARQNADLLENQARILAEFLRLAREERVQGRRTLLDILSGETSLINAQSDAAAAEADIVVAAYTMLQAVGLLELESVN